MSTFAVLLLCIQACLVQNVFSQCLSAYAPAAAIAPATPCGYSGGLAGTGYSAPNWASTYPTAGYASSYPAAGYANAYPYAAAPYGGAGEGNVAVAGELPVAGNTAVAGQVPIMGAVNFGGVVPAAGAVSVNGQCACGCGPSYYSYY